MAYAVPALTHYQTYPQRPPGADLPPKKVGNLDPMAPKHRHKGPNTSARYGIIKVGCNSGAIDSVELIVPFFLGEEPEAPDEVGPGFFRVEVRARIPGFD